MKNIFMLLTFILITGCQSDDAAPVNNTSATIEFEEVAKSSASDHRIGGEFVINTEEEWQSFIAPPPNTAGTDLLTADIDFNNYTVIAVMDGWHAEYGYDVTIEDIFTLNNTITVEVDYYSPPADEPLPLLECQPYHIVKIPKTTLPVTFEVN